MNISRVNGQVMFFQELLFGEKVVIAIGSLGKSGCKPDLKYKI
jgi:hypothetical protein